ncbi:TerC family protein, partial [Burkholderia sp. SIMBA_024]|uniref:TerC family protein n=1 Tax=Burkholderia sp. SIMBA_024 TaxID=3085768 RepID=UPI00397DBF90
LGIDNILFLSIITDRLPEQQRPMARRIGLGLALGARLVLLACVAWLIGLSAPLFELLGQTFSWRDLIMAVGGLFLIYKATGE